MSVIASQNTGVTIVYSTVCSDADQRKHQSSASLAFEGNSPVTGKFPAKRASNAENVAIWWRTSQESCTRFAPWWRHQMEIFSALLALCAGNSPVSGEFPAQRPVTRSFDVFFDLHLIKLLSKHSRGWWFETLSWPLWRHRNGLVTFSCPIYKQRFVKPAAGLVHGYVSTSR